MTTTDPNTGAPSTATATAASAPAPPAAATSNGSGSPADPERYDRFADDLAANLAAAGWQLVPSLERARVLSVYGPFGCRTMVDMPTDLAERLFPDGLAAAGPSDVIDGALKDIAAVAERDEALAESSLAATLVQMARELEHPYNSATSKAACAAQLQACRDRLIALIPPEEGEDALDQLIARLQAGDAAGDTAASAAVGPPDSR